MLLTTALPYVPSFLVQLLAMVAGVGLFFFRAKAPGGLLVVGALLQLLAAGASVALTNWMATAGVEGHLSHLEISNVAMLVSGAGSLVHGVGELAMVAAVVVAVLSRPTDQRR